MSGGGVSKRYNRHHVNFEKPQWAFDKDHPYGKMRGHPALIIPMFPMSHRLLHKMFYGDNTPVPRLKVAENLLKHLPRQHDISNRALAFASASEFLMTEARSHHNEKYAESAHRLGSHYIRQLGFIAMQEESAVLILQNIALEAA